MKKIMMILISVLLVGSLLSCASTDEKPQETSPMVQGNPVGSWTLVDLVNSENPVPEGITLLIMEEDGVFRAAGYAGVNNYRGGVEFVRPTGSMTFGMLLSTKMAGPNMAFESEYLSRISSTDSYRIIENQLYLYSGSELIAQFSAL